MAKLMFVVFLSISLQGQALTVDTDGLQGVAEAAGVTGDVCQDCTKIFELLADLLSNADLQKKIIKGIERVCDYLPGPSTAKICKDEVEKILPLAINFITSVAKPAEICKVIGLCSSCGQQEKMLHYFVEEALKAVQTSENMQSSTCSICIFIVKTLEDMLPKERTETAVTKVLEEICEILPASYHDQCRAIIDKFSKSVLEAILSYSTPKTICTLIHMCHGQEAPVVDPCTLTTYRCRDMNTAFRCGTLFYCQRFAWKPLKYDTV